MRYEMRWQKKSKANNMSCQDKETLSTMMIFTCSWFSDENVRLITNEHKDELLLLLYKQGMP